MVCKRKGSGEWIIRGQTPEWPARKPRNGMLLSPQKPSCLPSHFPVLYVNPFLAFLTISPPTYVSLNNIVLLLELWTLYNGVVLYMSFMPYSSPSASSSQGLPLSLGVLVCKGCGNSVPQIWRVEVQGQASGEPSPSEGRETRFCSRALSLARRWLPSSWVFTLFRPPLNFVFV